MGFARDYLMPDLSHRAELVELMDDTSIDEQPLFATLRDFKHINRFVSRIQRVLRETIIADLKQRKACEVSLLDIASGGCDAGLWFAGYCRKHNIACTVYCLDNDSRALSFAREVCRHEPAIRFIQADARDLAGLGLTFDYAFTNHFLHHLPDNDIPDLLRIICDCCRYGFVVNDLHRHVVWYLGFTLLSSILWRNGFTRADGKTSIRRGFKLHELRSYAAQARIDARISHSGLGHLRLTNIPPRVEALNIPSAQSRQSPPVWQLSTRLECS